MEETKNFEEQPDVENDVVEKTEGSLSDEASKDVDAVTNEAEKGVPIGKFKNIDDLYEAYNNLQAEFTRKCQKLSKLEKDKSENVDEELKVKFNRFLLDNQEAFDYADEIKKRVYADESLKSQEAPFEKVWGDMIVEKFYSQNKAQEPIVQNYIMNNDDLKNLVLENYVKQLQDNKTPYVMSSNSSGERVTQVVTPKPDTFEQARKIVLDMFS